MNVNGFFVFYIRKKIFFRFFRDFPQYCNLYPFKGLSCEELKSNKDFLDECDRLTEAIDEWTAKVDEPDQLKENLKEIGQSYDDPGFCEQYFRVRFNCQVRLGYFAENIL